MTNINRDLLKVRKALIDLIEEESDDSEWYRKMLKKLKSPIITTRIFVNIFSEYSDWDYFVSFIKNASISAESKKKLLGEGAYIQYIKYGFQS